MTLTLDLDLDPAESIALRRLANEIGAELPDAAIAALHDWLIGHGYMEQPEADNDDEP